MKTLDKSLKMLGSLCFSVPHIFENAISHLFFLEKNEFRLLFFSENVNQNFNKTTPSKESPHHQLNLRHQQKNMEDLRKNFKKQSTKHKKTYDKSSFQATNKCSETSIKGVVRFSVASSFASCSCPVVLVSWGFGWLSPKDPIKSKENPKRNPTTLNHPKSKW